MTHASLTYPALRIHNIGTAFLATEMGGTHSASVLLYTFLASCEGSSLAVETDVLHAWPAG